VRGLAAAELTRDYFLSDIPFDSYNTERVTINRGPNALLFGIGSPGGVINNSTVAPNFGENFHEVKIQLGERGSHRETFDFNRVIISKRVAIRGAALNEDTEFRQRPAWEKDRRVFGAIVAVLAENRRSRPPRAHDAAGQWRIWRYPGQPAECPAAKRWHDELVDAAEPRPREIHGHACPDILYRWHVCAAIHGRQSEPAGDLIRRPSRRPIFSTWA
jgi:hypothetical protein